MRRRAFTPEVLGSLNLAGRVVPSHTAGLAHRSVPLSGQRYDMAIDMVRRDFELFATSGDFERLRAALAHHTSGLPFHKVDGLGMKINSILSWMQSDLSSGVPRAIATAHENVVNTIHQDLQSRIDDGPLHVVSRKPPLKRLHGSNGSIHARGGMACVQGFFYPGLSHLIMIVSTCRDGRARASEEDTAPA
jgi:hypothetical protein